MFARHQLTRKPHSIRVLCQKNRNSDPVAPLRFVSSSIFAVEKRDFHDFERSKKRTSPDPESELLVLWVAAIERRYQALAVKKKSGQKIFFIRGEIVF